MAGIRTSISLFDGVTGPVTHMQRAMNVMLNTFESVQKATDKAIDLSAFENARKELAQGAVELENMKDAIQAADQQQKNFNKDLTNASPAADNLMNKIKGLVGAYAGLAGMKKLVELSDQMAGTRARLSLLVDDEGSIAALEQKIMASAKRSRSAYMDVSSAISKLALNAGTAFNNNMDDIIKFSELVNKQFVIAGATASEQSHAMLQLTQAMASGVLRGDELNSIFENAPNLIQNIANYLNVPIGQIRKMAGEGQITADIIKNAMFSAADKVNEQFESMPMTWSQVFTQASNVLLQALQPVLDGINWLANNLNIVTPIAVGAATALLYFATATWAADGAAKAFFATLLTNPLFWVALTIGVVVAAIVRWIQSIGGLRVAWLVCMNGIMTVWEKVETGLMIGVNAVLSFFDQLELGMKSAAVGIQNHMGNMKVKVLSILQSMINTAISYINGFISKLNMLPGVSISLVNGVTFATTAAMQNEAASAARNADLNSYRADVAQREADRNKALSTLRANHATAQKNRLAAIADARMGGTGSILGGVGGGSSIADTMASNLEQTAGNTGSTAGNTAAMRDSLEYMEEDLAYMKDIAEREAINRFTTAQVHYEQYNTNYIDRDTDIDGIIDAWAEDFANRLIVSGEGVAEGV